MSKSINRRNFLKASGAMMMVAGAKNTMGVEDNTIRKEQEYYELRVYKTKGADKKKRLDRYLEKALIPALGRMGIDRMGCSRT